LVTHILQSGGDKLPVLAGDWNAILEQCDTTRNFQPKFCKVLARIVTNLNYTDSFRYLHPNDREFTFHRGALIAQSRLDRIYLPPHLVQHLISAQHKPAHTDHCKVEVELELSPGQARPQRQKKKSFWKLNTTLLDTPEFKTEFQALYQDLVTLIGNYQDHAGWWEVCAKPAIVNLCKGLSSELAKVRKATKQFLFSSLKIFLRHENWSEVARVKEELKKLLKYEMTGVKIRSRQGEYAEEETGSLYHYNKERKGTGSNNLKKMRFTNSEGQEEITEDESKIEELAVNFYDALLTGRHNKDLVDTGVPFQPSDRHLEEFLDRLPTLSEESKTRLIKEMTLEELENIVKNLPNGKSPGLDGLPYELYKIMWDTIGNEFLQVIKNQMENFSLIESGRHGATVVPPKVEGVPDVTELRPITLLCCDYRIMSKAFNDRLNPVMGEVIESSQLATGEKEVNILTGAYDIIAAVDYVNKKKKPAFIASYDMVKAYDRASVRFVLLVMERMGFPEEFRRWVSMMHDNATTCLVLPSGLSRTIKVMFSFRQGDPIAMNLYILQLEPFLRLLRRTLTGLTITNFKLVDESYCDDVETLGEDVRDLVKFDEVMHKFEMTSGAILSRNKKSKVMGIGRWEGKQDWPEEVRYLKVVTEMKIFGFTICSSYQQTLEKTWARVLRGFEKVLFSWQSRQLETLAQRVEVAKTFALSKLYYVAQVLPLPAKISKKINSSLSKFIFRGRHERLRLDELENSSEDGGLGLPNITVKADALLLRQMCRMLNQSDEVSFRLLGYWLGEFLRNTGYDDNFPELADMGPVSHTMIRMFPLHQHMLDTFIEAVGRREVKKASDPAVLTAPAQHDAVLRAGRQAAQLAGRQDAWDQQQQQNAAQDVDRGNVKKNILEAVTTKSIYTSRMKDLLVPPKVELKFPQVKFKELVYPRLRNKVLEVKQKDLLFSLTHCIYRNRARLFQQNRAEDDLCPNTACRRENLVQDIEHLFCGCYKVRAAWAWTRRKMLELMRNQGRPPDISNMDFILAKFPLSDHEVECLLIIGTYVELVDREVVLKQKELMVNTLIGVLQAKTVSARSRAVPQAHIALP
jgi:hypothetical protein